MQKQQETQPRKTFKSSSHKQKILFIALNFIGFIILILSLILALVVSLWFLVLFAVAILFFILARVVWI